MKACVNRARVNEAGVNKARVGTFRATQGLGKNENSEE
jgi:hypothetical protein